MGDLRSKCKGKADKTQVISQASLFVLVRSEGCVGTSLGNLVNERRISCEFFPRRKAAGRKSFLTITVKAGERKWTGRIINIDRQYTGPES